MRHKNFLTLLFACIVSAVCVGLSFRAGRDSAKRKTRYLAP